MTIQAVISGAAAAPTFAGANGIVKPSASPPPVAATFLRNDRRLTLKATMEGSAAKAAIAAEKETLRGSFGLFPDFAGGAMVGSQTSAGLARRDVGGPPRADILRQSVIAFHHIDRHAAAGFRHFVAEVARLVAALGRQPSAVMAPQA